LLQEVLIELHFMRLLWPHQAMLSVICQVWFAGCPWVPVIM
jgi:hypothetical protein